MPIKGKTDAPVLENCIGKLQVVGRVWKGAPKSDRTAGKDLKDEFRFEAPDPIREKFIQHYGTDRPKSIRIYLPFGKTEDVFETWMEKYTAQGFHHRCDGEQIIQEMQPSKVTIGNKESTRWERKDCNKPCRKGDSPVCPAGCQHYGRFFFYVRELYSNGMGSTRCFMMSVTGIHDVVGLTDQLRSLQNKWGALHASPIPSPHTFSYIPYLLTRFEKPISRPNGDARARGTAWVLSIAEDPEWLAAVQRFYQEQEILRVKAHPELMQLSGNIQPIALPAATISLPPSPVVDVTEQEIDREAGNRAIAASIRTLGWTHPRASEELQRLYGKRARHELTDDEFVEFCCHLDDLVRQQEQSVKAGTPTPAETMTTEGQ